VADGERILQLFYVHPLEHAEGMLVAYLPRERILCSAMVLCKILNLQDYAPQFSAERSVKLGEVGMAVTEGGSNGHSSRDNQEWVAMRNLVFFFIVFSMAGWDSVVLAQEPRRVIRASAPEYPHLMYASGIEGRFLVDLTVLPTGDVGSMQVLDSAGKFFDREILGHVKHWMFEPQEGTSTLSIEFVFRLLPREAPLEDVGVFFVAPTTIEVRTRRHPELIDNKSGE
jgi:TonB family protein